MTNRIITLDYLRGIAAVIVMVGHYFGWVTEPVETPILLHKLVTFSVSIFYILSGITLYTVYKDQFEFRLSKSSLQSFYAFAIKRMFRILPLLWLATTATILILSLRIPRGILIFNYTGLFGFISNRAGIARAAWSIGNEVVFYIIFPLFVYLARRTQVGLLIFSLASLLCAASFR